MEGRIIGFTQEQLTFLKSTNASKLVRDLLDDHMKHLKPESLEQKQRRLLELKAKAEYEQKLKEINGHTARA